MQRGYRWSDVPAEYGPAKTLYNRYKRWSEAGVCVQLEQPVAQVICVISAIGNDRAAFDHIGRKALICLCDIGPVASRQVKVNRPARAVTHQVRLRVQPASGLADGAAVADVF